MTVTDFTRELEEALDYISMLHPDQPRPILVGHSAGGGLSQATLANTQKEILTSGVILVAAFPPTGGWSVYVNWFLADPWFGLRMILHGGDPKSPLSSPALVQKIFFGPKMKGEDLLEFFEDMNPEESVGWPNSMMFPFVDVEKVKQHADGKVAWIGGQKDVIMSPKVMKSAAKKYNAPLTIVPSAGEWDCVHCFVHSKLTRYSRTSYVTRRGLEGCRECGPYTAQNLVTVVFNFSIILYFFLQTTIHNRP